MSDGSDVGFGVYLKTKIGERQRAGDMTEVHPTQRYNAHMVPEDGSLTCSTPGICKWLSYPVPLLSSSSILPESARTRCLGLRVPCLSPPRVHWKETEKRMCYFYIRALSFPPTVSALDSWKYHPACWALP